MGIFRFGLIIVDCLLFCHFMSSHKVTHVSPKLLSHAGCVHFQVTIATGGNSTRMYGIRKANRCSYLWTLAGTRRETGYKCVCNIYQLTGND